MMYSMLVTEVRCGNVLVTESLFSPFFTSQEKRLAFPRFYFLGDDDLLEILGQATNPQVIQVRTSNSIHNVSLCLRYCGSLLALPDIPRPT